MSRFVAYLDLRLRSRFEGGLKLKDHNTSSSGVPPRRGTRAAETRQLILETAVKAFGQSGYDGVKISRLCKEAKIANGTFYLHFADKTALYRAVMQQAMKAFLEELSTANQHPSGDPVADDRRDIIIMLDFAAHHPWLAIAVARSRFDEDGKPSGLQKMIIAQRSAKIAEQQKAGIFLSDLDPMLAAHAEAAVTNELLLLHVLDPEKHTREAVIEHLAGFRQRLLHA